MTMFCGSTGLTAIARTDPGLLEAVSGQLPNYHNLAWLRSEMLGVRANYDPQTALTEAMKLTSQHGRHNALQSVGRVWARTDPLGAFNAASQIADHQQRSAFLSSVMSRWIEDDPDTAMQTLLATLEEEAPSLKSARPDADADLALICERAMHRDPAMRYTSAAAFANDLQAWLDGELISVRAPTAISVASIFLPPFASIENAVVMRIKEVSPAPRDMARTGRISV